jgi:hypothetical protein
MGRVWRYQATTADFLDFWWSIIIIILGEASDTAKLMVGLAAVTRAYRARNFHSNFHAKR